MQTRSSHDPQRAFSLVELVIVIIIIGIIAAIAIPRLSVARDRANIATLKADLAIIRSAIDRYQAEHLGRLPNIKEDGNVDNDDAHFIERLTGITDQLGERGVGTFGPYLRVWPANRFVSNTSDQPKLKIEANPPPNDENEGWHFDKSTGLFYANSVGHGDL